MSQGGAAGGGNKRLKIYSDRLLLVEGQDEVNLFNALIQKRFNSESNIQVIPAGGIDRFPVNLKAIQIELKERPDFQSMGVVRDADDNPSSAFESVCNHLRKAGYTPPDSPGSFSAASPSVGVFIVPDGTTSGAIETLCRRSVEDTDIARCVGEYLKCLAENGVMHSSNEDKSFAHAYLAATDNPVARVGEGALGGVWNFDDPEFQDLSRFLDTLASSRR